MLKQFLGHGLIYTLANILTRGISFLLLPFYTRVLSPVDYGLLDIIMLIVTFVNLIIALEVTQAIARYLHDLNLDLKIKYVSTAFNFTIIVYLIFSIFLLVNEKYFYTFIFEENIADKNIIYKLIITLAFFNGLYYFVQNQLRWNLQVKENAIVNVLNSITAIAVTILLVLKFELGIIGVLIGLISGNVIGSIVAFVKSKEFYKLTFDKAVLKKMLIFSLPLVPSSIAVFFNLYMDRLIIKHQLGLDAVGLYAVAYKFATIISLVIVGFQSSLTPLIYANYDKPETPATIERIFRVFCLFVMIFGSGISIFSQEILKVFTQPDYFSAFVLIAPLAFATVFSNIYIFTPGMAIKNKTKIILLINFIGVAVNVVLTIILINKFGLYGVSIALLISNFIVFMLYLYFSQNLYRIPFQYRTLISVFTLIIGLLFLSYIMDNLLLKIIVYSFTLLLLIMILFNKHERKLFILKFNTLIFKLRKEKT